MKNHTQNLFRINNLANLDFSFKLVEVDLQQIPGQEILYNTALQKVSYKVASEIGGPAAIVFRDGKHYIAIPANRTIRQQLTIKTNPFTVNVKVLDEVQHINLKNAGKYSHEIISKFLDFEIRQQLKSAFGLWDINSYQFFLKNPIHSATESNIDIFGGFKYRLVQQQDGNYFIALDLAYKYLDRYYLPEYVDEKNHNERIKQLKGRKCLYQNGDNWYPVEIVGFGKKISVHETVIDNSTHKIFDYVTTRTKSSKFKVTDLMSPEHLALLYKYPGRAMEPHHGATSLAKLVYNTNDQEVKALHKFSIKNPDKKFEYISDNINRYFQKLQYNGVQLNISKTPEVEQERFFPMPELKGNNDYVLSIRHGNEGNTALADYGGARKKMICDNGILNKSEFDNQYLIVPSNLERNTVDAFKKHATGYLKKLAPNFTEFKVITYTAKPQLAATLQVQEIESILQKQNALDGFALFILPDLKRQPNRSIKNFHDCLKNKFFPNLKFQCASAYKIQSFYQPYTNNINADRVIEHRLIPNLEYKFKSYLFNLVMEYLLVNRKWPFALMNNLHYDTYIGIDVHERYAGFTFFYKNGEHIFFDHKRVAKKTAGNRYEKLKKDFIAEMLLKKLESHIAKYAPNPNGIVIIRDGRSFGEEELALNEVIGKLAEKGLVDAETLKKGVIDLHKQSAIPFRMASGTNGYNRYENPRAGSYKFTKLNESFLFNTGYPFQIPGTAKPLHLILQSGNVDFKMVMEDLFAQTMMAFSAPDRSNSLPITIKLIDTFLEPLAAAFEDEVSEEDEVEDLVESL